MTTLTSFLGKPFFLGKLCAWGQATNSVDVRGSMDLDKNTKLGFTDSGFYDTGPPYRSLPADLQKKRASPP